MNDIGAYELQSDEFSKISKTKSFIPLSLPETYPDYFVKTTKVPKAIEQVWKKSTDRHCNKNVAQYFFKEDDAIVFVAYESLPDAAAKLKVEQLQRELVLDLKSFLAGESVEDQAAAIVVEKKKSGGTDEHLRRVVKEGLRKSPKVEEIRIWASRAVQNFAVEDGVPADVKKLVDTYKFAYNPVYNTESQMIIGAITETNPKGIAPKTVEDVMRDNMAQINAAHIELETILASGKKALVMTSIDVRALVEDQVRDFIIISLKKIPHELRKFLVVEIRGIRRKQIPPKLAEILGTINVLCRSLVIDTGILSCPDFSRYNFKPFAYSFNYSEIKLPEEQRINLMKRYVATYRNIKAKTLIKNVPNKSLLYLGDKLGFTFLSGPMVFAPQLKCPLPKKIDITPEA